MKTAIEMTRQEFEDAVFQPPRTVRMLEALGRYVKAMDRADREYFTKVAQDAFFDFRGSIKNPEDVRRVWTLALNYAAGSRRVWRIWTSVYECKYVKGATWRGRD